MLLRKISVVIGVFLISVTSHGQKKYVVYASMEKMNAEIELDQGNIEMAKKRYLWAKQYIDLAVTNDETRNDQKALWLQADIYSRILFLGMDSNDKEFGNTVGSDGMAVILASLKKAYAMGEKFREQIILTAELNRSKINNVGQKAYATEQYDQAAEAFKLQATFADCIDVVDTVAIYNAAICYQKTKQLEKAALQYERLDDPNNKQLYLDKATVLFELGKNEAGEKALNKALEIDPNDADVQLRLGASLVNWVSELESEMNNLSPNETAKRNEINKKRQDLYNRALVPLEKYIAINPKNKSVLTTLYQIYQSFNNTEKAMEFKRRADNAE